MAFAIRYSRSLPIDAAIARILDANFNRAREAVRVMEDYARFVLDDPRLSEQAKGLRHGLAEAIEVELPRIDDTRSLCWDTLTQD